MSKLSSDSPPIVLEVKQLLQDTSILSLFNMSLLEFLEYANIEAEVRQVEIQTQDKKGDFVERAISNSLSIGELQLIVQEVLPQGISIDIQLGDNYHIDSNFRDEVFFSYEAPFDAQGLIQNILRSRELEDKYLIPADQSSFCYVLQEGKMMRYDSFRRYLSKR